MPKRDIWSLGGGDLASCLKVVQAFRVGVFFAQLILMKLRLLLFILFMSLGGYASTYDLSTDGPYSESRGYDYYEKVVEALRPGDELRFSNGKVYTIDSRLGNGHRTVVYSIKERPNYVLRLPRSNTVRHNAKDYLDGYKELQNSDLRIVEILPESNLEYILAEKLPSGYKIILEMVLGLELKSKKVLDDNGQMITGNIEYKMIQEELSRASQMSREDITEMENALVRFVEGLAQWLYVGDLHEGQLAYDPNRKEWILIDWDNDNVRFVLKGDPRRGIDDLNNRLFLITEWLLPERTNKGESAIKRLKELKSKTYKALEAERLKQILQFRCGGLFAK